MEGPRIFAFLVTDELRERFSGCTGARLTSLPPWEERPPAEPSFDLVVLEVTPESVQEATSWLTAMQTLHPEARTVVLGDPSSDPGERATRVLPPSASLHEIVADARSSRPSSPPFRSIELTDEERLEIARIVIEGTNQTFFLIQDGIILFSTIPFSGSRGWEEKRLVGRHFCEFLHASSRPKVLQNYNRRMSGEQVQQRYEALTVSPTGEAYPVELLVHRIDFRGRPAAVGTLHEVSDRHAWLSIRDRRERELSLLNDVTRHIISGRRLRSAMTQAMEAILDALDSDAGGVFLSTRNARGPFDPLVARMRIQGRFRVWRECSESHGLHLDKSVLARLRSGGTVLEPPCEQSRPAGPHHVVAPLRIKKTLRGFLHLVRRDGDPFDDDEAALLSSLGGELAMGIENRRLYEDLQSSYQELVDTQKELVRRERLAVIGNMAAHVAHEIRNPVATIMNASGQIRKRINLSGVEAELSDIIEEELQRLRRLCDDLVLFSRKPQPAPRPVRVEEFIEGVVDDLEKASFIPDPMSARVDVSPSELEVEQDPDILYPLIRNLAMNAIQSMGNDGSIVIKAYLKRRRLAIDVVDTGPGIPPEIIDRIFDPFFTTHPESSGLGLAIVRNYVEEMGGELAVSSEPGQGTTIHLLLPHTRSSQPPAGAL
jgi:PAS domain S-box-containing protein